MATIIYSYGALTPTANLDVIEDQLHKGHRYRNALVECERKRRDDYNSALIRRYPRLGEIDAEIKTLYDQIGEARKKIKTTNAQARKKVKNPVATAEIKVIEAKAKLLKAERKILKEKSAEDTDLQADGTRINEAANKRIAGLRAECGLFSGTYQIIEKTIKRSGRPPQFHRWTGEGRVAVYIQDGLTPQKLFSTKSTLVQLDPLDPLAFAPGQPRSKRRTVAKLRVQSDEKSKPVWATIPVEYHRQLPDDAIIRWAWLIRKKVGPKYKYSLQFTILTGYQKERPGAGRVALNLGWRRIPEGLRVAAWLGDGERGEIVIPQERMDRWQKVEDLQSIRAKEFNTIKDRLQFWLAENPTQPEWLVDRTKTISHWTSQSQARLASLVLFWRDNRFGADKSIYDELEAWRKQDKHLWTWESNQRRNNQNWRKQYYIDEINALAEKYNIAYIGKVDWAKMRKDKPPEVEDEVSRLYRNLASVGILTEVIRVRMTAVELSPEYISQTCNGCGEIVPDFQGAKIMQVCPNCGEFDQDHNAAANLLDAGLASSAVVEEVDLDAALQTADS